MITWTNALEMYTSLTKNTSASNLVFGAQTLNDSIRTVCSINGGKWPFLEVEETVQTVADQAFITLPNNIRKVMSFRYTQGLNPNTDATYTPKMLFDSEAWERILSARLGTSNYPLFGYQKDRQLWFTPIPSTSGNLISLRGRRHITDLSIADYTAGTIASVPFVRAFTSVILSGDTSATLTAVFTLPTGVYSVRFSSGQSRLVLLTNGATSATWSAPVTVAATSAITVGTILGGSILTGTGTTFTRDMIGRWIRITQLSDANTGDGAWYKISDFYNSTTIGISTPYQGTEIAVGTAAYRIGQCSVIPEAYQIAPIYRAAALYWNINNPNKLSLSLANQYWRLYDGGVEVALTSDYGGIIGQMMQESGESMEGPYISPLPRKGDADFGIPFYSPWNNASGL